MCTAYIFTASTHVQFHYLDVFNSRPWHQVNAAAMYYLVRMHKKTRRMGFNGKKTFGLHAIFEWADTLIGVVSFRVDYDQVHLLSFASVWRFLGNHHVFDYPLVN